MYSVCIYFVKVVSYYDVHVSDGFHKTSLDGLLSSIQFYFGFLDLFNFAKPLGN